MVRPPATSPNDARPAGRVRSEASWVVKSIELAPLFDGECTGPVGGESDPHQHQESAEEEGRGQRFAEEEPRQDDHDGRVDRVDHGDPRGAGALKPLEKERVRECEPKERAPDDAKRVLT